jgi:hypothetical protein
MSERLWKNFRTQLGTDRTSGFGSISAWIIARSLATIADWRDFGGRSLAQDKIRE